MEISELSTHLQGQLVAVHPAYDELFDGFSAAPEVRGKPAARTEWAKEQVKMAARGAAGWAERTCDVLRRAHVAHGLSLAPTTKGAC